MQSFQQCFGAALAVIALVMVPMTAFAAQPSYLAASSAGDMALAESVSGQSDRAAAEQMLDRQNTLSAEQVRKTVEEQRKVAAANKRACEAAREEANRVDENVEKILSYDPDLITQIGTQEQTGHTICCPSFSCAYADCVLDGTVHDHSYYTCSCCTWNDWGEGSSWDRCVGSDQELLKEAYDQIRQGKPTVVHVASGAGEHWIALIGYRDVADPDHLDLSNFVALDPWDGVQIVASERYVLYGDGCEHITSR